ncbi:efflux RND transporter periplasmic adaptor subunit [Thermosulfurimonas sp. F29]|uniref:efflux RND transporter periplasmic adaptor subunit n=1 Tax=Thermosulfurimonas sp. F29 TaxID=2867247 RepID=UPI001C82C49E|nr:efflux RND transporter periplasmic adaptor subunit [Thermosulfurimonas sp. F29]MBX6422780.1 efflux RND transporter periplasmic adaptor subunit [Thermosulfurimonas sp. F29]
MRRIKPLLVLLVAGLAIVFAVQKVREKRAALRRLPPPRRAPLPVEVAPIRRGKLLLTEHYLGEIRPLLSARISSRLSGYLLSLTKYEGDRVEKGEVLARIDDAPIRARIASLRARIEAARVSYLTRKRIFERDRVLYREKAISEEAFELSESAFRETAARLETLRAELSAAENDLTYTVIRAPFSGVVTARLAEPGDMVVPGKALLVIEAPSRGYRVLVGVPQRMAVRFRPGAPAFLTEGERRLAVRIFRVHPAVGEGGLATVEIRLPSRPFGLPSGARVGVDLATGEAEGFIVPLRALLETTKGAYVFTVERGEGGFRVRVVRVKVRGRSGGEVVLSGDLSPGVPVVVAEESTLLRLHEGEEVLPERENS